MTDPKTPENDAYNEAAEIIAAEEAARAGEAPSISVEPAAKPKKAKAKKPKTDASEAEPKAEKPKVKKEKKPKADMPVDDAPSKPAKDITPENAHPALQEALSKKGYTTLTPVQAAVLDSDLDDRDLLVSAQTGSGKTVAFGLAMATSLLGDDLVLPRADAPLAVIIAPTRELALQVKTELTWLYKQAGAKMASCVGGMDMRDERRALSQGAHIVVGTPGRLCDHIKRGSLNMSDVKCLALDEADEMLKMGFREELELILNAAPAERRTLLFSATVPKTIAKLAKDYQRDAVRITTKAEASQHLDIEYRALTVAKGDSEGAIINVLRYYDAKNAIVFGDTRIAVNRLTQRLNNRGFSVVALSGELNQKQRSDALQALRDGRAKVCVATDVAARGLDLPDLELVIHASLPKNPEYLLHRSGRTGRAGRKGVSALIVPQAAARKAKRLLQDAKITAEWANPPSAAEVESRDDKRMMETFTLTTPVSDDERAVVTRVLAKYSPEQIATAYLRQYRESHSAPEELGKVKAFDPTDDSPRNKREPRERKQRDDFQDGVWFSLNLGRKQRAEARWILPMLSKSGDLKKDEIGAIKITEGSTFVEVAPSGLQRFLHAIGPSGKIEKAITATQIDGTPDFDDYRNAPPPKDGSGKPHRKTAKHNSGHWDDTSGKKPFKKGPKKPSRHEDAFERANNEAPLYTPEPGKKPHKKKLARAKALAEERARGKHGTTKSKGPKSAGPKSNGPKLSRKKRRD